MDSWDDGENGEFLLQALPQQYRYSSFPTHSCNPAKSAQPDIKTLRVSPSTLCCRAYYYSGNIREAIAQYRHVIHLDPRFLVAQNFLVETLERTGLFQEALLQIDANNQRGKHDPDAVALRRAYQSGGALGYLQEGISQIRMDPQGEAGGLSGGSAALYAVLGGL